MRNYALQILFYRSIITDIRISIFFVALSSSYSIFRSILGNEMFNEKEGTFSRAYLLTSRLLIKFLNYLSPLTKLHFVPLRVLSCWNFRIGDRTGKRTSLVQVSSPFEKGETLDVVPRKNVSQKEGVK